MDTQQVAETEPKTDVQNIAPPPADGVPENVTSSRRAVAEKPAPSKPNSQSQKMSDPGHAENLVQQLQRLLTSDAGSCDLALTAGDGTEVAMHSIVARALAPALARLLPQSYGQGQPCRIPLETVDGPSLQALVHYMYYGDLTVDNDSAGPLLTAATALELKGAQELCGRYLQSSISKTNVLKRFVVARQNSLDELMASVLAFVDKQSANVLASAAWLSLEKMDVEALLSRNTLSVPEDEVYQSLRRWYEHDKPSREKQFLELFLNPSVVRLPFIDKGALGLLDAVEPIASAADAKEAVHAEMKRRLLDSETTVKPRAGQQPLQQKRKEFCGKRIVKQFTDGKLYWGAISDLEIEESTGNLLLCVKYDDGDTEDLYEEEVEKLVAAAAAAGTTKAGKQKSEASKKTPKPTQKRKAVTPKKPAAKKAAKK